MESSKPRRRSAAASRRAGQHELRGRTAHRGERSPGAAPARPVRTRSVQIHPGADPAPSHGFHASTEVEHNDSDPAIPAAVLRAQAGDKEAMRFLYLRYKNNVYGYVLSMLRDEHEAEDVTQHVFLKLMSVIGKYEPRKVPFTAWVIRVARNVAVDHQRQRRPIPCEEVLEPTAPADDSRRERRWGLEDALRTLPEDQRGVVVLRHLVGLTPGEIAVRMGRTEASIHGLHHRARQALRRELRHAECAPTSMGA